MKKEYVFFIIGVLVIGIVSFLLLNNRNKVVSTITLDINPSMEINLDKENTIIGIKAINDDAKNIVGDSLIGKGLEEGIDIINNNLINNGYDKDLTILLYSEGKIEAKYVGDIIVNDLKSKNVRNNIIFVENVSKEDKELAKKYNVSPAKMSYVKSIKEKYNNLDVEELVQKTTEELNETKYTGNYCEKGYELRGNSCFKEISRTEAIDGSVCPSEYYEYKGKCYRETRVLEKDNLLCDEEFTMEEDICVKREYYDAVADCERYDSKSKKCIELEYIGDAYEFCRDPGRTLYEHKCLATKPTINGGCLGKDKLYKGKCVNTRNDYYAAEWKCKNGKVISNADGSLLYDDKKCYEEKKVEITSYHCERNDILEGDKCLILTKATPRKEVYCPSGYSLVEFDRCINYNDTAKKINGKVCSGENTEQYGNECITYEVIPPLGG